MSDFEQPLGEMQTLAVECRQHFTSDQVKNYAKYIDNNVSRIVDKLQKLKTLKAYKTIKYIKDIKMIDLS